MNPAKRRLRPVFPQPNSDDLSSHAHRQLIGVVGLLFPVLLWLVSGWRPTGEHPWAPLGSISAYYYSGAVSVFAGLLIALAIFLFSYRGYNNKYYLRDRIAASIAGAAAVLVAFYPTDAPAAALVISWWTPPMAKIHQIAAGVLFTCFAFFAVFQFPLSSTSKTRPLPREKRVRNWIYFFCGLAMVSCMVWVFLAQQVGAPIFWPEALALEFFAISWLVKGRAYSTAAAVGGRALYYGRHPRRFAQDARHAFRRNLLNSTRLEFTDKALTETLRQAEPNQRLLIGVAVCRFALRQTGFSNPLAEQALMAAMENADTRAALQPRARALAEELDRAYFDLVEAEQQGRATRTEVEAAFQQARAACAVVFVLGGNSPEAASDVIYEANAATGQFDAIRGIVEQVLRNNPGPSTE